MPQQLSFNLPAITALGREDFFVSPANAAAVAMVEAWQNWPARKLALIGPASSGKTHLVHVWATLANAQIVAAASLARADIPALAMGNVAVEDVAGIAGIAKAEAALFHLHNLTLAEGNSLLLTASRPPNFWQLRLPDLASRMSATPIATLAPPDDSLLIAVLIKLFTDRQLAPTPETIPYLTRRIDRSFIAARQIVDRLDAASLETGRAINRALAAEVLDKPAQ